MLVEGFKDTLAAAALGANAYGLPGAGCPVPEEALPVLADKHVVVAFDGDEAGQEGTLRIVRQLHAVGIRTSVTKLPDELDVTDLLVRSRTHSPVG